LIGRSLGDPVILVAVSGVAPAAARPVAAGVPTGLRNVVPRSVSVGVHRGFDTLSVTVSARRGGVDYGAGDLPP
jgi:hypothetical protein